LTAKKASQSAKQKERELIFASLNNPPPPESTASPNGSAQDLFSARRKHPASNTKQLTKEELEVDASTNVTASLRRTHDLLSTELSRSRFAQETFDQSTAALADLGEKYSDLGSVLGKSRELLGTLLRSQKSDTWYLETAFYLLIATLGWLVFRRILWGPFFLLPRFLFRWLVWPPISIILSVVGLGGRSGGGLQQTGKLSTSRPPLIVQPSAKRGSQPRFPEGMSQGVHVPVGGGGEGAKAQHEQLQGEVSEDIGKMAEESERQAQGPDGKEEMRRADGTVLEKRGEKPRNPKKKMFEADVEDAKYEEQQKREKAGAGKRDEL
jgi:protein transport protein SEC20